MSKSSDRYDLPRLDALASALLILILVAVVFFTINLKNNPPGFYIDESSIAYNAYTISQTGRDELGTSWPLFFQAFGDYKNPVYIYLLAGIFKITGPGILVARVLSVVSGLATALLLGWLAFRITRQRNAGLLVTLFALLTPWLFELSRVVLEVALYPFVITVLLLCVHKASTRVRWSWREAAWVAGSLALVTYTYSIGRLLGPLLAIGLIFFGSHGRRFGVALTWGLYALTLVPLLIFRQRHPGALTGRFSIITYITPQSTRSEIVQEFIKHYFANINPLIFIVKGDPNEKQIAHLYGSELILFATMGLVVVGLWLVVRRHWREAWWRFIFFGLVVSAVPASLTKETGHMLRLAPLLVFLLVLIIPAVEWLLLERRGARLVLVFLIVLTCIQGAAFQRRFQASAASTTRRNLFDGGYPDEIFARAVVYPARPIYLADALSIPGYIQAYWYATLRQVPLSNFVQLPLDELAPSNALVITTENTCRRCRVIATSDFYTLYVAGSSPVQRGPLPEGAFKAHIKLIEAPPVFKAKTSVNVRFLVKNDGNSVWLARERTGARYQVSLGNHWLGANGELLAHDDGRSAILEDLKPGQERELSLTVTSPGIPGNYFLEVDMLQEGVTWFGLLGSQTLRVPVRVE